jgi:aryl carrier-like protein
MVIIIYLNIFQEICDCLGDGLLKVYQGIPITRYIPKLKWDKVEESVGLSSMFKHLLVPQEDNSDDVNQDNAQVLAMVLNLLGVSPEDFSVDVPFVGYGLDSLGATRIAEALRPYANISQMQLLGGLTWNKLQERFHVAIAQDSSTSSMLDMVAKYSVDFGSHVPLEPTPVDAGDVTLITGTTGAVGASVLAELVSFPAVGRIYALNRKSTDGRSLYERQKQALEDKGLDPVIIESPKINLLEGDLIVPGFNLENTVLEQVCVFYIELFSSLIP